jgi:histidinol phosphatase-like enzyme
MLCVGLGTGATNDKKIAMFPLKQAQSLVVWDAECDVEPAANASVKAEPIEAPETRAKTATQKTNEVMDL